MDKVFLHIFNTAVIAGWLVLAVMLVRFLLKKAPAWVKCALWAIVAVRLVWPFEIESILSLIPSTQTLPPAELYAPAPQIHTGVTSLNSAINPVFTPTFTPEPSNSINPLQVAVAVASVVWVIGMLLMAVYTAVSYLRLRRYVRVSMPAGDGVYLCDNISSPFILGIVKPKIYLPSDLSQEKWASILAHERAHLARKDHWWKPLGFGLLTVFWFHPLLWLAYVLLCRDVELACDEKVIKTLSDEEKQNYSQTLLDCSVPRKWIAACPLAFGETGVKQRIKAVLHYKKPTLWILIIALIACTVLAVCFLTDPAQRPEGSYDITAADVAGKQYVYEKEGAGSAFYISIYKDGTFQYYAGMYSSHIGLGNWKLKDGKLYLYDTTLQDTITFVFTVEKNALLYIDAESAPFMYVDVADGDRFNFYTALPQVGVFVPGAAEVWYNIYNTISLETGEFQLAALPEHTLRWGNGKIEIVYAGEVTCLIENATINNLGAVDLNMDGYPELCTTVSTEKNGEYVIIYDIANKQTYTMIDPSGDHVYYLYTRHQDGSFYVMCAKDDTKTGKAVEAGRLIFVEDKNGAAPAIKEPTLHSQFSDTVTILYNRHHPDSAHQGEVELDGFGGVSVRWYYSPSFYGHDRPVIVKDGKERVLFENFPAPKTLYITDITGDGKPDLCADIYYFFSGLHSYNTVCVYDYANDCYYVLHNPYNDDYNNVVSYYLRLEDGQLLCDKIDVSSSSLLATGKLFLADTGEDMTLCMEPIVTYDSPVDYVYTGAHSLDRVTLSIIHEGTCALRFMYKPEGGVYTSSSLRGTYTRADGKLIFHTDGRAVYVFRFEGEDLVFVAKESSELPENCILYDGAVLKANVLFDQK